MVYRRSVPLKLSVYWRYLHSDKGLTVKEIAAKYPEYSRATVYRHCKKIITAVEADNRKSNAGRPRLLTEREGRSIIRNVTRLREVSGRFSARRLKIEAGVSNVSDRTVRRLLNRHGYFYLQSRKKGLMSKKDMRKRVKFARHMMKNYPIDVWTNDIAFYLDAVGFVHKINPADQARAPSGRIWRRKSEGLTQGCTSKGSKVGHGGKVVNFLVAISYGAGVILCEQYEKMNGAYFATFIDSNFEGMFNRSGKNTRFFLQDGDPSQNSKLARDSMNKCGAVLLTIPPRSPDINPIENVFHTIRNNLTEDAAMQNIQHETYEQFSERARNTILNMPAADIDRTIDSMPRRMKMLLSNNGQRLRY